MPVTTRAKFVCTGFDQASDGTGPRTYQFYAVTNDDTPENERYYRATPSGSLRIAVDNPAVEFTPGSSYYLDITAAN